LGARVDDARVGGSHVDDAAVGVAAVRRDAGVVLAVTVAVVGTAEEKCEREGAEENSRHLETFAVVPFVGIETPSSMVATIDLEVFGR
jgi:hypothetical protein